MKPGSTMSSPPTATSPASPSSRPGPRAGARALAQVGERLACPDGPAAPSRARWWPGRAGRSTPRRSTRPRARTRPPRRARGVRRRCVCDVPRLFQRAGRSGCSRAAGGRPALPEGHATAPTPTAVSTHSGAAPSRSARLRESRWAISSTKTSGVNSSDERTTVPSGATIAEIPLVAATATVRPCSTARSRLMRQLLLALVGVAERGVVGLDDEHPGAAVDDVGDQAVVDHLEADEVADAGAADVQHADLVAARDSRRPGRPAR